MAEEKKNDEVVEESEGLTIKTVDDIVNMFTEMRKEIDELKKQKTKNVDENTENTEVEDTSTPEHTEKELTEVEKLLADI